MSKVVDRLAELTGFRDRDMLDTTLVTALRDLLRPRLVAIHRVAGDDGDQRWLTRARIGLADAAATADPIWVPFDTLPRLADLPLWHQTLQQQERLVQPGPPHLTVFPLTNDREAVGVLEVETARPMNSRERQTVASILRIYRNFQVLLDYSERDTLTGLLNRKTFDEAFYKLQATPAGPPVRRGRRRQAVAGPLQNFLCVIDIDHFKAVNDNFGHLIGDEVLLLLSRLMRASFRFHDQLYRFGGEEFVALMGCGGEEDAAAAAERFRLAVQGFAFPQVGHITVSVGYSRVQPGDTASNAFERADKAVYWAKSHGRNQVCSHADLVARNALDAGPKMGDVELF